MNNILFSSKSDQWSTPQDFYDKLDQEFHFDLDPCADSTNHKTPKYFTKEQDGLQQNWGGAQGILQSSVWSCNKCMGGKSIQRRNKRWNIGCPSYTREDRHKIFP